MPELKERFRAVDGVEAPELWAEARRRAAAPEAPPRALESPRGAARRVAVGALAFAVFAVAVAFAWDIANPDRLPTPRPAPAAVDLAAELPTGWSELPAPPENRSGAATAWTGSELLVWGGYEFVGSNEDPQAGGFAFDPLEQRWTALPASPLTGRSDPAFGWTGSELLIWGGWDGGFREPPYFDDGAAYDPVARIWRTLPPSPLSARSPFSVWTGTELIVWGSTERTPRMRDGAAYDPSTDSWRRIAEAPTDITDGSAVWTGDEMIVFGAALDPHNRADTPTAIGIAYDPATDTWRRLPPSGLSPQAMTASWLDGEMIAWDYDQATAAYSPATDSWRSLPDTPLDFSECYPKSVATSRIVFGEFCGQTIVSEPGGDRWRLAPLDLRPAPEGCCWVLEPVAAGNVVFVSAHLYGGQGLLERRLSVYNPAVGDGSGLGEVVDPEPFIPGVVREGAQTRMPVVFPDGSRATLVFPSELVLEEVGVQPDVTYLFRGRYQGPILFLHAPDAPLDDFVDTSEGSTLVNTSSGGVEVLPAKSGERLQIRAWIRFELRTWSVLVPFQDLADVAAITASLELRESATGFPFVVATGEAELAQGFGEAGGPQLAFGDARPEEDIVSQLDSTIFLGLSDCAGFETEVSPDYGAACLGNGNVFASIYGLRGNGFVPRVIEGLRVEDFRAA
ncbi:MAG TPA: hypothetical protein VFZ75_05470 [Actinomycetota bacterium]|nr:hypothetical protein [Actinomycetota bacterium]